MGTALRPWPATLGGAVCFKAKAAAMAMAMAMSMETPMETPMAMAISTPILMAMEMVTPIIQLLPALHLATATATAAVPSGAAPTKRMMPTEAKRTVDPAW